MPRGQPTKLTPERAERIEQAVAAGNTVAVAAGSAGISERSLMYWLDRGRAETARLAALPDDDPDPTTAEREAVFLQFLQRIEAARQTAEAQAVAIIRKAMTGWTETTTTTTERIGAKGEIETETKTSTVQKFNWNAAAWWLERTRPHQYGRFTRTEVTGADGAPLVPVGVEDLRARARQLVEDELAARRQQRGITNGQVGITDGVGDVIDVEGGSTDHVSGNGHGG